MRMKQIINYFIKVFVIFYLYQFTWLFVLSIMQNMDYKTYDQLISSTIYIINPIGLVFLSKAYLQITICNLGVLLIYIIISNISFWRINKIIFHYLLFAGSVAFTYLLNIIIIKFISFNKIFIDYYTFPLSDNHRIGFYGFMMGSFVFMLFAVPLINTFILQSRFSRGD